MNHPLGQMLILLTIAILAGGCTSLWQTYSGGERRGVSSSLVEYLYPGGEEPPAISETIPRLELPLRVGLAFVPSATKTEMTFLSEAAKASLLERARQQFLDREYIAEIAIIPETYMRAGTGFTSLQQVSRIYSLDVIALVSYDQVVATDDTTSSFLYWTIIGAYVVKGSKNDVQTFVDTAVFDIPTRQLLFRAPGIDKMATTSTLIKSAEDLRETRTESFGRAMDDMSENLVVELNKFEFRIENEPAVAEVIPQANGSGGGGAISLFTCLLLFIAVFGSRRWGAPSTYTNGKNRISTN
jgi:rhombotail lipoprotein